MPGWVDDGIPQGQNARKELADDQYRGAQRSYTNVCRGRHMDVPSPAQEFTTSPF